MKLASFEAIVCALNEAGARYRIADGLAVNARGYLRFTKEAHIVLDLVAHNIERTLIKPLYGRLDVRFVSIGTPIRMKETAVRPQDRIDIEHLRLKRDDDERR